VTSQLIYTRSTKYARAAGTVQTALSRSSSLQRMPRTSPERAVIKIANARARAAGPACFSRGQRGLEPPGPCRGAARWHGQRAGSRASTAVAQSRTASMRWRTRLAVSGFIVQIGSSRASRSAVPRLRASRSPSPNKRRTWARSNHCAACLAYTTRAASARSNHEQPPGRSASWLASPAGSANIPSTSASFQSCRALHLQLDLRLGGFRSEAPRARFPDQSPDLMSSPGHARSSGGRAAGTRDREIGGRARGRPRRPRCRGGAGGDNAASSRR
jgi:hypothetical protein